MQQAALVHAREPAWPVDPRFVQRWSPRSFRSEPVPRDVLHSMAEAARWAPSSANLQPWRFLVSDRLDATRKRWNEAVGPGNRAWMDRAPVLVWVVARKSMGPNPWVAPETPNPHSWFDTGMATIQFVLEGERHGVRSHMVGGIDPAKAHAILGLDADHEVVCAMAVGYPDAAAALPPPLQARETPSPRKAHDEVVTFA